MKQQLVQGVNIHYLPTKQFKTVQMSIQFKMPLKDKKITTYSLLSQLLVTNTEKYPTQTHFRQKLAELYGAKIACHSFSKGHLNIFSLNMSIVNDHYLQDENVYEAAVAFMEEVLFHPHWDENGHFDEATVARERKNLYEHLMALSDDKVSYARHQLSALHFDSRAQQLPSEGSLEDLEKITSDDLTHAYKAMMATSEVDIIVVGDVAKERVIAPILNWSFKPRQALKTELVYTQPIHADVRYQEESQKVAQAKLNLAYFAHVLPYTQDYYIFQVFNGIFGGFPHSKLFMEVREKNSMAYYASSQFDPYCGTLFVQSGIETGNAEKVQQLIAQQLCAMQAGEFTPKQLKQTQQMLIQLIKQLSDFPSTIISRYYEELLTGRDLSLPHWIEAIEKVTMDQVQAAACQVTLQAVFLLKGEAQ
ncbi:EF-P 5-aminopentanol modification-associated protein YfmF [Allofustis seminis]|uniref:EF-P 5-aminopentanol modification-associated protein YfmF n=1 Tax=Allofustis seminis TaxID=166939 RepID=UPI00036C0CAE|nr:pitrilysin family protein [Allofustis seminis]